MNTITYKDDKAKILVSDVEGIWTVGDFAFELASRHINPDGKGEGGKFFKRLSDYVVYVNSVTKREGWEYGGTLKLLLPFLAASGVGEGEMHALGREKILMIPDAQKTFEKIKESGMPYAFTTTGYHPYTDILAEVFKIGKEHIYSSKVDFSDAKNMTIQEKDWLLKNVYETVMLREPMKVNASSNFESLSDYDKETAKLFDNIFFEELPNYSSNSLVQKIQLVGGKQKAKVIEQVAKKYGVSIENVVYPGDSITDIDAFDLVNKNNGYSLAFNATKDALEHAKFRLIAQSTLPVGEFIHLAANFGKQGIINHMHYTIKLFDTKSIDEVALEHKASKAALRGEGVILDLQ